METDDRQVAALVPTEPARPFFEDDVMREVLAPPDGLEASPSDNCTGLAWYAVA